MNNIRNRAMEIINKEHIFVKLSSNAYVQT